MEPRKCYLENTGDVQTLKSSQIVKRFERLIFSFMHIRKSVLILFEPKLVYAQAQSLFSLISYCS